MIAGRQIHLDFHTSGLIDGVGTDFDAASFGRAFADADVESVCLFTRCHHGYCYYPTQVGTIHPGLHGKNLLDEQIKALDAVGVKHTFYTTVCWDELSAKNHPEWRMRDRAGHSMKWMPDANRLAYDDEAGWTFLCWNGGYKDFLHAQIREVCESYHVDEMFVDIVFAPQPGCLCETCLKDMAEAGLNPDCDEDVSENTLATARKFMAETTELIHSLHPDARVWFNARLRFDGCVERGSVPEIDDYMRLVVIESLPSGFWGYNHFPLYARYYQNKGYPMVSHTGRFQKMWGDFGGLKNQAALDYECWRMVSMGSACSVGDQLHPSGAVDEATYRLVGNTYKQIAEVQPYSFQSQPLDEIGVLLTNQPQDSELLAETGAMRMLMEKHYQFSFIDDHTDLSKYRVVVLPDRVQINKEFQKSLESYLANGGKLLVSGASGRNAGGEWVIPGVPVIAKGRHPFSPYYVQPQGNLLQYAEDFKHVLYSGGDAFRVTGSDWDIQALVTYPYFNRTAEHFCSHLQTPPATDTDLPELAIYQDQVAVIGADVFSCYAQYANRFARDMVEAALDRLIPHRIFQSNLPTTAEVIVRRSGTRTLVHLMHYVTQRRGVAVDIVEDVIPLRDINMSAKVSSQPTRVFTLPDMEDLDFEYDGDRVRLHLPELHGFRLIVIE